LLQLLADAGDDATDPIPVAIEARRGLLVAALRATGRRVYSINPMAVARYRDRHSVARKKSDHIDAMVLANILRTDAHAHRPLPGDSELARAIAVLARAHQDATWRRTRASNELRLLLREYFPVFLGAFAGKTTNPDGRDARAVLAIALTLTAAAKLSHARIAAALRKAGQQRGIEPLSPQIQHDLRVCVASAHIDLATAQLRDGGLDEAVAALDPVLSLHPNKRASALPERLARVRTELASPAYQGQALAADLDERIEAADQIAVAIAGPATPDCAGAARPVREVSHSRGFDAPQVMTPKLRAPSIVGDPEQGQR
jgi:hypothetical protein